MAWEDALGGERLFFVSGGSRRGEFDRKCWWVSRFRFVNLLQSKEEERDAAALLLHPSARRCGTIETFTSDSVVLLFCCTFIWCFIVFYSLFLSVSSFVSFCCVVLPFVSCFFLSFSFCFRYFLPTACTLCLPVSSCFVQRQTASASPFSLSLSWFTFALNINRLKSRPSSRGRSTPGRPVVHFIPRVLRLAG